MRGLFDCERRDVRAAGQKVLFCRQIKKIGVFPAALGQTEHAGDPTPMTSRFLRKAVQDHRQY
jgi:hypothetical protein